MSGLARKVLILATIDGLVIQPLVSHGQQKPSPSVKIGYGSRVSPSRFQGSVGKAASFECHGIAGFVSLSSASFLVAISKREQVASIRGHPVYTVTGVTLVPLSSSKEASNVIAEASLQQQVLEDDQSSPSVGPAEQAAPLSEDEFDDHAQHVSETEDQKEIAARPGVLEKVIAYRGAFGNLSKDWLGRPTSPHERRTSQSMSASDPGLSASIEKSSLEGNVSKSSASLKDEAQRTTELLPKFLKTVNLLFSARNFYFSYEHDLTRGVASQHEVSLEQPLHKRCDPNFFWNAHMVKPFLESNEQHLILPLMQGFVGQSSFSSNSKSAIGAAGSPPESENEADNPAVSSNESCIGKSTDNKNDRFLLTLISRRSVHRPGLRYLRRGVDERGFVANFVETEQILSSPDWNPAQKLFSFTQIRGSIPIFFSQTPYTFKPSPVIHGSFETNHRALTKHFDKLRNVYGSVQVVSLLDKGNHEAVLGSEYQKHVKKLQESSAYAKTKLWFNWFDFHAQCRGMKFENINVLVAEIKDAFDDIGQTVEQDGTLVSKQKGIIRTNCMDCLDRTGVAHAAFGRTVLAHQLKELIPDPKVVLEGDMSWFNFLWADNGDAISRQYSSTAALKGDFTRTGKRNYQGALRDLSLTLSRYYNNIINDYFTQTTIDFLLGTANSLIFQEFEAGMSGLDPAISLKELRQRAIESSSTAVPAQNSEELLGGWTILTPSQPHTLRTVYFTEVVMLLTNKALYLCQYDWDAEKLTSSQRIGLSQIQGLRNGTYITSTHTTSQMDEIRNFGFVIKYTSSDPDASPPNNQNPQARFPWLSPPLAAVASFGSQKPELSEMLAFKAVPARLSTDLSTSEFEQGVTEKDVIRNICFEIERAAAKNTRVGQSSHTSIPALVEEKDIVSLADAKKGTGLVESLGHYVKTLVWA